MKSLVQRAKKRGIDPKTLWALEEFEAATAKNPNDATAFANMGRWWHTKQKYVDSLSHLTRALELDNRNLLALYSRGDLLATCPDDSIRNGRQAINDITCAIEIAKQTGWLDGAWRERMLNRILAAAYAETGQFQTAIDIENQSAKLAITKSATRRIDEHLEEYKNRKPIRSKNGIA